VSDEYGLKTGWHMSQKSGSFSTLPKTGLSARQTKQINISHLYGFVAKFSLIRRSGAIVFRWLDVMYGPLWSGRHYRSFLPMRLLKSSNHRQLCPNFSTSSALDYFRSVFGTTSTVAIRFDAFF
jgi:hypothetical protein